MQLSERLAITVEIAEQAGHMIREARQEQNFGQHYKHGRELVTDVDVAIDRFIADQLEARFPGEARLTEELSPERETLEKGGDLWVVDPIDGTVNFAQGLPHVAVSIAWAHNGKVQLGVVHAPFLVETFTSTRGDGARLNGKRIRSSLVTRLEQCLIATGFPYRREGRAPLMRRLSAVMDACQDMRRCGSAALDLCNVACGRLDAYYESVSPWDFAAGYLIAQEAGARAGHLYPCPENIPEELYGEHILVAAPDVYKPLKTLLIHADENRTPAT
ncbi:myo-inositol-1(or 4)-monophosphatase [Modicisalibacter ilicicola DSM 19980]|uniref:Inositol-1-monophosphatase n=1 Tax=Modicisalibacter ilicicola DSM 19980 TaxID=1121942 RepID=A0A1M4XAW3_9GAMM|nr:inositol monophosphatase family protein [Halomonas ilicicola]SHE90496.1 myo-inositol-1(or 4)-monophosphatase [Halomonas ilicicola DSM 19980]